MSINQVTRRERLPRGAGSTVPSPPILSVPPCSKSSEIRLTHQALPGVQSDPNESLLPHSREAEEGCVSLSFSSGFLSGGARTACYHFQMADGRIYD